jgi:hypothetical protein
MTGGLKKKKTVNFGFRVMMIAIRNLATSA